MILVNALNPRSTTVDAVSEKTSNIFILTGPIQTGKTTSLVKWSAKRKNVAGILTPVVDGKRVFMNAGTREQFRMEAETNEKELLVIGRFIFSKNNFDRAIAIIRDAADTEGWLVIDEIGPMELTGRGFCKVLKETLATRKEKILLVVREGMTGQVQEFFKINEPMVIRDIFDLP